MPNPRPYSYLVNILRSTLEQVEKSNPDDPAIGDLKSSLVRTIAELDVTRSGTRVAGREEIQRA